MSEWVNDTLQKYAEQIQTLLKHRFLDDDYEVARFYDKIEAESFHVDFFGIPYVTTVALYGLSARENKLIVKIVDKKQITTFSFKLPKKLDLTFKPREVRNSCERRHDCCGVGWI